MGLSQNFVLLALAVTVSGPVAQAGSARALLDGGESALKSLKGMPVAKMTPSAQKEVAAFLPRAKDMPHRHKLVGSGEVVVFDENALKTGGVINTLKVHEDGSVVRSAIKMPESLVPAERVVLSYSGVGMDGLHLPSIYREFQTPAGRMDTTDVFFVSPSNGRSLRKTYNSNLTTERFSAWASLSPHRRSADGQWVRGSIDESRDIDLEFSLPDRNGMINTAVALKGTVSLPENIPGHIVHFRLDASGNRLTVLTSEGQELEFALKMNPSGGTVESRLASFRRVPGALKELEAASKVFPGRKSANSDGLRGLDVQSDGML